ncbi:MAG: nucleotide exchange factor GrpE [Desulfovibrionales bacterium]
MTAEEKQNIEDDEQTTISGEKLNDEELRKICRERFCEECPELAEKKDELLRVLADSENYRKRLTREKDEFCKFATESVLEDLLPIIDNLELALKHGRTNEACKDIVQGVDMTLSIFHETLKRHGLTPVGQEGEEFNPVIHEAMGQEERKDVHPGHVCSLLQRGYKLRERLIRPAKVIVSKEC